jgi:hypothetical protein
LERVAMSEPRPPALSRRAILILLAVCFAVGAGLCAWKIIAHTQASTDAIEETLKTYNMKNEGAQTLERFDKAHPILGTLFGSTVKKTLKLPSTGRAEGVVDRGVVVLVSTESERALCGHGDFGGAAP